MKYLLLFAILFAVWWLWRAPRRRPPAPPPAERPVERMVACARCGVLLPESEAVLEAAAAYCCEAHRQAGPAARA